MKFLSGTVPQEFTAAGDAGEDLSKPRQAELTAVRFKLADITDQLGVDELDVVQAVKVVRAITDWGLKESLDFVKGVRASRAD
ncbi:MAG: hypothetical protein ABSE19_09125 [Candidatus Acidiferrum sp.]|jgi:ribosomal protein L7/L12